MGPGSSDRPLNRISTLWTVVCQAHAGTPEDTASAQRLLLQRYGRAVHRYLLRALPTPHDADDLAQEFALRFVRGDFKGADPQRGRFRDYVKGVLGHLIVDHFRRRARQPAALPDNLDLAGPAHPSAEDDRRFTESWREELLARAWEALGAFQLRTGQPYHSVLRFRVDHPDLRSAEMARQLGVQLGKPLTAAGVRQSLRRAREKFSDLLLDEVAQTLDRPTPDRLEEELADLGLLEFCRPPS
jgi:RNA polymerase sigma-70 factor (ECF subfamily)